MKNLMLLAVALSIAALAGAVMYHAQTGRYQISSVAGLAGVYKADTKTGDLFICSPVYESGCVTIAQAHMQIVQQREAVKNSAAQASDKIDQFTKDSAKGLQNMIQKLTPDKEPQE